MKSAMIALLLTVWAVPAPGETAAMSTNLANFMTMHNGDYNNLAQYQADNKSHDFIQLRTFPVVAPGFPGKHMAFVEYAFNGAVFNLFFCEVTEDSNNRIHFVLYNFTDPSQYKPGQYKVEDLAKLKPEDLHSEFNCEAEFEAVGPDFYGTFPACRHFVNGKPSMYTGVVTCDEIRIVVPRIATEESSSVPYHVIITGPKHPVPDLPDGYISPCK